MLATRGSNTQNPIHIGKFKESLVVPWLYGTDTDPEGEFCKICWNTFNFGGYVAEYKSISKFLVVTKTNNNLVEEFLGARGI